MKKNLTFLLFLLPFLGFAQGQWTQPALIYTEQDEFLPITDGYGIGIDVDEPFARLHLNDKSTDGIALRIDMQDYVIPGPGNPLGKSLYAIQANSLDESGIKVQTVFSVDRSGKISSGYSATQNDDQVSVKGPLTVYQSSNYSVGLTAATGLQPELTWRALQSKNFRFRSINTGKVPLALSQDGRVGVNTDDFFDTHNLYVDGSVYIKDDGEQNYSLYIEGTSIAEEMVVKVKADWGDYVFKEDYLLLPLNDLEKFIAANGHLPEMPTAAQVKEEGVKTGETIRLLTVKVEELTLYLLQQQKEIEALRDILDK